MGWYTPAPGLALALLLSLGLRAWLVTSVSRSPLPGRGAGWRAGVLVRGQAHLQLTSLHTQMPPLPVLDLGQII